ncbi:centromere protein S-like [Cimex lectularius]|uniref:Centromere protein S n=1 Tax=Cimex lectularius TaxID=79782 RepID=A0A8I6RWA0_CIMLE|nr:centromere protein S-like [Cimex lectularius]XP_014252817.1 centromere protein S-like [Cimex lectularius]XP_014252818.1 centromere protein S-like [Cimex lectularius]
MDWKSLSTDEKLKLTTYLAVSKTCDDVGMNNTIFGKFTVNKDAKQLITEFIWKKMQCYATDLEHFARHAKRSKINYDDIKLLFRYNEKILEAMTILEKEKSATQKPGKRKREAENTTE